MPAFDLRQAQGQVRAGQGGPGGQGGSGQVESGQDESGDGAADPCSDSVRDVTCLQVADA